MAQRNVASSFGGANALLEPGGWDRLRLAWRLLRDPRVAPRLSVAVPLLTLLYVVSPIDLLPDVLLGLGQIDDLGVIGLAVLMLTRVVPRLAPADVLREHRRALGLDGDPRPDDARGAGNAVIDADFRIKTEQATSRSGRATRPSPSPEEGKGTR